jgi:hypothetical protein
MASISVLKSRSSPRWSATLLRYKVIGLIDADLEGLFELVGVDADREREGATLGRMLDARYAIL